MANADEVFALHHFRLDIPLILITIITPCMISSSGTGALAVNHAYRGNRRVCATPVIVTAALGRTFVGRRAFEWTKLISEGGRPR